MTNAMWKSGPSAKGAQRRLKLMLPGELGKHHVGDGVRFEE